MERMRTEPVPADELQRMKSFLVGSFPLDLETGAALIEQIVSLQLRGLPLEDLSAYPHRVEAIDAAAVQRAASQYLQPAEAIIVVVGDAAVIRKDLEQIAPVTLIDAYGVAVK
jgi:zinc protease